MTSILDDQRNLYGGKDGPPLLPHGDDPAAIRPAKRKRRKWRCIPPPPVKLPLSMMPYPASELPEGFPPELAFRALAAYSLLRTLSVRLRLSPFTPNVFLRALQLPYPSRLIGLIHVSLLRILLTNLHMGYQFGQTKHSPLTTAKKRKLDGLRYPLRAGDNLDLLDRYTWPIFYDDYCHLTADVIYSALYDENNFVDMRNLDLSMIQTDEEMQRANRRGSSRKPSRPAQPSVIYLDGDDDDDVQEAPSDDEEEFEEVEEEESESEEEITTISRRGRKRQRTSRLTYDSKSSSRTPRSSGKKSSGGKNQKAAAGRPSVSSVRKVLDDNLDETQEQKPRGRGRPSPSEKRKRTEQQPESSGSKRPSLAREPVNESDSSDDEPEPVAKASVASVTSAEETEQMGAKLSENSALVVGDDSVGAAEATAMDVNELETTETRASVEEPMDGGQSLIETDGVESIDNKESEEDTKAPPVESSDGTSLALSNEDMNGAEVPVVKESVAGEEQGTSAPTLSKEDQPVDTFGSSPQNVNAPVGSETLEILANPQPESMVLETARVEGDVTTKVDGDISLPKSCGLSSDASSQMEGSNGISGSEHRESVHGDIAQAGTETRSDVAKGRNNSIDASTESEHKVDPVSSGHDDFQTSLLTESIDSSAELKQVPNDTVSSGHDTFQMGPQTGSVELADDEKRVPSAFLAREVDNNAECRDHSAIDPTPVECHRESEILKDCVLSTSPVVGLETGETKTSPDESGSKSDDGVKEAEADEASRCGSKENSLDSLPFERSPWQHFDSVRRMREGLPYHRLKVLDKLIILEFLLDELLNVDTFAEEFQERHARLGEIDAPYGKLPSKEELDEIVNDDECAICTKEGELLCCDGCPASYHKACIGMPEYAELPEGIWLCPECELKDPAHFGPLKCGRKSVIDWFSHGDIKEAPCCADFEPDSSPAEWMDDESKTTVADASVDKPRDEEFLIVHGFLFRRQTRPEVLDDVSFREKMAPFQPLRGSELDCAVSAFQEERESWPVAQLPLSASYFNGVQTYDPSTYTSKYRKVPLAFARKGAELESNDAEYPPRLTSLLSANMSNDQAISASLSSGTSLYDPYTSIRVFMRTLESDLFKASLLHERWVGSSKISDNVWQKHVETCRSIPGLARLLVKLVDAANPRAFLETWFQPPKTKLQNVSSVTEVVNESEVAFEILDESEMTLNNENLRRKWERSSEANIPFLLTKESLSFERWFRKLRPDLASRYVDRGKRKAAKKTQGISSPSRQHGAKSLKRLQETIGQQTRMEASDSQGADNVGDEIDETVVAKLRKRRSTDASGRPLLGIEVNERVSSTLLLEEKEKKMEQLVYDAKGPFLKEILWPVAGRKIFDPVGYLPPSQAKRLGRNAGTVVAPFTTYSAQYEVGQPALYHVWRKRMLACQSYEEMMLYIRTLETYLDTQTVRRCMSIKQKPPKMKGKPSRIVRSQRDFRTGLMYYLLLEPAPMDRNTGRWVSELQIDLFPLLREHKRRTYARLQLSATKPRIWEKVEPKPAMAAVPAPRAQVPMASFATMTQGGLPLYRTPQQPQMQVASLPLPVNNNVRPPPNRGSAAASGQRPLTQEQVLEKMQAVNERHRMNFLKLLKASFPKPIPEVTLESARQQATSVIIMLMNSIGLNGSTEQIRGELFGIEKAASDEIQQKLRRLSATRLSSNPPGTNTATGAPVPVPDQFPRAMQAAPTGASGTVQQRNSFTEQPPMVNRASASSSGQGDNSQIELQRNLLYQQLTQRGQGTEANQTHASPQINALSQQQSFPAVGPAPVPRASPQFPSPNATAPPAATMNSGNVQQMPSSGPLHGQPRTVSQAVQASPTGPLSDLQKELSEKRRLLAASLKQPSGFPQFGSPSGMSAAVDRRAIAQGPSPMGPSPSMYYAQQNMPTQQSPATSGPHQFMQQANFTPQQNQQRPSDVSEMVKAYATAMQAASGRPNNGMNAIALQQQGAQQTPMVQVDYRRLSQGPTPQPNASLLNQQMFAQGNLSPQYSQQQQLPQQQQQLPNNQQLAAYAQLLRQRQQQQQQGPWNPNGGFPPFPPQR